MTVLLWSQDSNGEWWCAECFDMPTGLQLTGVIFKAVI